MSRALARSGAPGAALRAALGEPHVVLGAAAALVLALELVHQTLTADLPILLEAAVAGASLVYAWRAQARLRLAPLLVLALAFHLAWVALHLGLVDVTADKDSSVLFRSQGNALLRGDYPRSEYPVGAVILFALEAWLGDGTTRVPNALLMIPFQLAIVAAVWATRSPFGSWLAAFIALWPLNAYHWEFKFDLVPAALLAVALVLALRERWAWSGALLGLGAAVKWTPAFAFVVLLAWLLASGRRRAAGVHSLAFTLVVLTLYVPFLLWSPNEVLAAYERQSGRTITPESVWYLPLRLLGLARVHTHISFSAGAPEWANVAATAVQVVLVLAVVLAVVRMRGSLRAAITLAAAAPVVLLLTNRIFSPQFIVVVFAALVVAAALHVRSAREQLAIAVALAGASFGNAFVFPFALPWYDLTWPLCSAVLFALALGTTAWVVRRSLDAGHAATWRAVAGGPAAS